MRRSICYCEPASAQAGEVNNWKFVYTSATSLPKGTRLKFDMLSNGRDIDWQIPSSNVKKITNIIYGELESGKIISAKEVSSAAHFTPDFEFILPSALEAGSNFTIVIGTTDIKKANKEGNRAQTNSQRRRPFNIYIDPTGQGNYGEPEVFCLDIKGNTLCSIRVVAPSYVTRNKRFDVIVRFEDQYGNLTSDAPDETLIELSYEHLRENLNWKLFVPETGFIALPNLYFNEPGIYTIRLLNTYTQQVFQSPPIKCFADNNKSVFWGILHGESERIDSTENIENCLRHFRDDKGMNFFGASPFESQEETSNEMWKLISQNLLEFDENDRFTTFLGTQWSGIPEEEGTRQIVFTKDHKQPLRKKDAKYSTLKKIYKSFSPKEIISIPTFTMGKGYEYNFKNFDPDYERVVEIYNAWGSSECLKKEGNLRPIQSHGKVGVQESAEGSIQKALLNNCRFGFVAGGLDDRGIYAPFFEGDQVQYSPGLTAIIAAEHTRASLAEALYTRSCYATTGERIIVGLYIAGMPMGSEISTAQKHGLLINRHISGFVAGTTRLKSVEIIRNGKVLKSFHPESYSLDFTFDDMTPLETVTVASKDKKPPFVFYYIRVVQEDGHMAWSSPIWVDYVPSAPKRPVSKNAKPTVKLESLKIAEDEEEDNDFDYEDDEDDDE
ncbi:Uncharacterized protein DB42_BP00520 [Neochlamydia sp. EPS4]|uniref:DUF3604 domain-containing protein n=1 Tax=Neochlamydia sp. EPS4 TaxID=1478175 RepID=UPI000583983A|nr:DUF3604 domain-containing protein [Neochlamydia sp. EPS4]KIC73871.1 Uncharacterized protein DB42_BP00520 [Neochlamydia sp. EPS4]